MKKIVLSIALVVGMTSAHAWGQREQDTLRGLIIGGALASQQSNTYQPHVVYPQQQIIVQPAPHVCGYNVYCGPVACYQQPVWDQFGRVIAYQTVCR